MKLLQSYSPYIARSYIFNHCGPKGEGKTFFFPFVFSFHIFISIRFSPV
uniref:ORF48c n=1 Tax=Pinus koraiensis TaxID=88728 RepID=Q85WW2_PINKO|nr:ORF48c [Pinus koraiensis]AAO74107.1 ORF48c [Pinus koraiensis]